MSEGDEEENEEAANDDDDDDDDGDDDDDNDDNDDNDVDDDAVQGADASENALVMMGDSGWTPVLEAEEGTHQTQVDADARTTSDVFSFSRMRNMLTGADASDARPWINVTAVGAEADTAHQVPISDNAIRDMTFGALFQELRELTQRVQRLESAAPHSRVDAAPYVEGLSNLVTKAEGTAETDSAGSVSLFDLM